MKNVLLSAAVLAQICAVSLSAPLPPIYSSQYITSGTVQLPYGNINEPFNVWFDGENGMQLVKYYGDLDSYLYIAGKATYQVNPVYNESKCFLTPDPQTTLTPFLPDLTKFKWVQGGVEVNGVVCNQWNYSYSINGSRVSQYSFYTDQQSGIPISYEWLGIDNLLGSHYDHYIVTYKEFSVPTNGFPPNTFMPPSECGPFPGPGFTNPSNLPAMLFGDDSPYGDYAKHHGRDPDSERQAFFNRNLKFIHMTNRKLAATKGTYRLGVNHLVDATDDEMKRRTGWKKGKAPAVGATKTHTKEQSSGSVPTNVDWRTKGVVLPVRDQGVCGSCWSFGAAHTMSSTHALKTGNLVRLSSQALMDCGWATGSLACDGGEDWRAYEWLLHNDDGNAVTFDSYGPYLQADGRCHQFKAVAGANITGYVNVTAGSMPDFIDALSTKGVISISIDAAVPSFYYYSDGIYNDPNCASDPDSLDHTVSAVGYGTDPESGVEYTLIQNSWSTNWGEDGYVKIARKDNLCGVATSATYTIQ